MKIQDILFIIILVILVWKRNPKFLLIAGILSLILAIPLFKLWVFFTADRLVWYAAGFFALASILLFIKLRNKP